MDSSLLRQFGNVFEKNKAKFNQKMAIFGFFLLIATALWYLNKLSHEYTTTLSYPVRFVNLPRGKVLVGDLPKRLDLKVNAYGYTLLRYKMSAALVPVEFSFSEIPLRPIGLSKTKYYVLTSKALGHFSSQLSSDIRLDAILPDSLVFEFASTIEKRVKVEPVLKVGFAKQFMLAGTPKITPDSITISGPQSLVDTISAIYTKPIRLDRISKTVTKSVALPTINQIGFSHRKVEVSIAVEKFTEASVKIPVEVINIPDSLKLTIMPRMVAVKCNVIMSRYFDLKPRQFRAVVDYSFIDESLSKRLRVKILEQPSFIQELDFEPKFVEYLIERK
ncbi:MAG: YbbR-like domain-containing protein [Bacteroidales bacterium]|nr:YbbR-like domain-containing protein [Bacteroidales bacterium]MBN2748747.1 YbbR-like domain-containing protein [Bacteroidales bacterium]